MFKSLMAVAAVAGMMMFSTMEAGAVGCSSCGPRPVARHYTAAYAQPYHHAASYGQACAPSCPRTTQCVNYTSAYQDCNPRYVAGDCMTGCGSSGSFCGSYTSNYCGSPCGNVCAPRCY